MYTPPATAPMRHATPVSTNVYLPSYISGWWISGGQKRFYYEDAQGGLYDIDSSTRINPKLDTFQSFSVDQCSLVKQGKLLRSAFSSK